MTEWGVLLLGIGLGMRHATDADHVVVVSALVQREPGLKRAASLAALWGLGHGLALLACGVAIVLARVHVPASFDRVAEILVALMLIGFGTWHAARPALPLARSASSARFGRVRPLLIGVVHGLAGSAGLALLASASLPSRALAFAYLGLFGLGTVMGMVALTIVIARPIAWTMARGASVRRWLPVAAGLLSVALGIGLLAEA